LGTLLNVMGVNSVPLDIISLLSKPCYANMNANTRAAIEAGTVNIYEYTDRTNVLSYWALSGWSMRRLIDVAGFTDYNENSMIKLNPHVIFIDPPWGGADYKNSDTLTLKLGDITIEDLINNIINKFSNYYENLLESIIEPSERTKIILNNYNNKLIVLKLPKNYDIEYFYTYLKSINVKHYNVKTYLYILNKMLIIIVELSFREF
jgi:hypothetical protein